MLPRPRAGPKRSVVRQAAWVAGTAMRPCSSLADALLIRVARLALTIEAGETPHGSGVLRRQVPLAEVIERFGAPA